MNSVRSVLNTSFLSRLVFFCFEVIPCLFYSQELSFRHYGTAEGLPSSEAYCVIQDSKGYIWFSTDRGLAKFNGYEFTTLTVADGLPDNTVFALNEDYRKRIWFSTYTARTGYLLNDSPHIYVHNNKVRSLVHSGISSGLYYDHKDRLWIGNTQLLDPEPQVRYIDTGGVIHPPPLAPEPGCIDIYPTVSRNCLINGSFKVAKARILSLHTDQVLFYLPLKAKAEPEVFCFTEKNGTLWICLEGQVWSFETNKLTKHVSYSGKLLSFMVDEQKNLWLGFQGKGLSLYLSDRNYKEPILLLHDLSVSDMCLDSENGKWFTTLENGVFYLPPGLCFSYSKESGLSSAKVLQIDHFNGNILAVQSDFNASVKENRARTFKRINPQGSKVLAIKKSTNDTFYYSSNEKPIHFSIPETFIYIPSQKIYISGQNVWNFVGSKIACNDSKGKLKRSFDLPRTGRITCLFEENPEQDLIIGTVEGLYKHHDGKIIDLRTLNPALKTRISGVLKLRDSVLAIATMGQGLLIVRKNNFSRIEHYTVNDGLPSVMCNTLQKENDSILWIGTNKGLCRINYPEDHNRIKFQTIDMHHGLASNEITDLCFADKNLWVATQNGISLIQDPQAIERIKQPPLLIEKVLVNGRTTDPASKNTFSHKQNNISISFIGLNYQHPTELRYRYRLMGADSIWKTTDNRNILYSALMPGNYLFELQVISPNGYCFGAKRSLAFTILSPYWKSWWFLLILIVILTSGIYTFVVHRINSVKKQAQLRHALDIYRDKALRAQMNPHFIYNSMNAIQNYITKNDTDASISFLSRFSRLMRLTFQNSFTELVQLEKDLRALVLYTEMESIRFPGKFRFELCVDENTKASSSLVPPLLIQPFVENAILHAFPGKEDTGYIRVQISTKLNQLYFAISDNGIGRGKALLNQRKKGKFRNTEDRKESGITVTVERIRQAWGGKYDNSFFKITDLLNEHGKPSGTLIEFYLPLQ